MLKCCSATDTLLVDVNDQSLALDKDQNYNHEYPFGETKGTFNQEFWKEVFTKAEEKDISKVEALRRVRVDRISKKCDGDILVDLITTKHDKYFDWCTKNNCKDMYPTFVFELTQLAKVILEDDFKNEEDKSKYLLKQYSVDGCYRNIIHLAAERNLTDIMLTLLSKKGSLAVVTTYSDNTDGHNLLPLHYALNKYYDEAASMLIEYTPNERVRYLFGDYGDDENDDLPTFSFSDNVIAHGMKKTVEAILDCLMNPDWPYIPLPENDDDKKDFVLPNLPFRYHFFYRLLDGDDTGLPGKTEDGKIHPDFNIKAKSCLQLLADNSSSEDAVISHPVVRMLMRSKWNKFGRFWARISCLSYILFLTVMSVALLCQPSTPNRKEYSTALDYFRLFCEIATLLFTVGFMTTELNEILKQKAAYLSDPYNYFDVPGLVLILVVIPLRFSENHTAEYAVSAAAYLINFIRISKCGTAFESMTVYVKTISAIIITDISRFAVLWGISLVTFSGTVYLTLKASKADEILLKYNSTAYWHVFMQEVRSLAEASGFAETDDYHSFHTAVTIFLMFNMFFCLVVLNNILIGQIGNSYSAALSDAKIRYDIDRTRMVIRIESQMLCLPWSLRTTHYVDKEFLSDSALEEDLMDNWMKLKDRTDGKEKRKRDIKIRMKNIKPHTAR